MTRARTIVAEEFVPILPAPGGPRRQGRSRASAKSSSGTSRSRSATAIGHLVLHLTGNLNHYIGALVAGTGYVRDREHEFTDPAGYPRDEALARFHEAVELVVRTLDRLRTTPGFSRPLTGQQPDRDAAWAVSRLRGSPEQSHRAR